jgi:hypothetical protein
MKTLAETWKDDPALSVSSDFHDEGEEQDEIDEGEDGCGGVQWRLYVLKKNQTCNKQLHELAREVRGVEKQRGKRLTTAQYKLIFDNWATASQPYLRVDQDYFTEFLAKLDCVTVPKGETLQAAFERAKLKEPPSEVLAIPDESVRLFASLCRELHEMGGGQPIMLCQASIGKLFGHSDHRNISNWIRALKTVRLLELVEPARKNQRAARYSYRDGGGSQTA